MAVDLLSLSQTLARTGLSERTFYRVRARGEFPAPVKVVDNARLVVFLASDVDAWCAANRPARVHRDP